LTLPLRIIIIGFASNLIFAKQLL